MSRNLLLEGYGNQQDWRTDLGTPMDLSLSQIAKYGATLEDVANGDDRKGK